MINLPGLLAENTSIEHTSIVEGRSAMPRKVLFEPIWKFHAFGYQLLAHPPAGYELGEALGQVENNHGFWAVQMPIKG